MSRPERYLIRELARDARELLQETDEHAALSDTTFLNVIERDAVPKMQTLQALALVSGVSLRKWMGSLGLLPDPPTPSATDASTQRWQAFAQTIGEDRAIQVLDWFESLPGFPAPPEQGGNNRAKLPTLEGQPSPRNPGASRRPLEMLAVV